MALEKLQLKQLSKAGELLNVITCHAGQVSVFRAVSPNELKPYIRALAGIPGPERFVINVDDRPFVPADHNLIGFGESFSVNAYHESLRSYLETQGVPAASVDSLCYSFGLDRHVDTACSALPACEERRARVLAATFSSQKVLVIHEPFEPITSQWRERIAEYLVTFVRQKKGIVIVPSLSYRPDYWIDNDRIARIQVGESIQRTIGFGTTDKAMSQLVSQVREEFKHGTAEIPPKPASPQEVERQKPIVPTPKESHPFGADVSGGPKQISWRPVALVGTLLVLGVAAAIDMLRSDGSQTSRSSTSSLSATLAPISTASAKSADGDSSSSHQANLPQATVAPSPQQLAAILPTPISPAPSPEPTVPSEPRQQLVLDLYAPNIKASIMKSFEGMYQENFPAGTERRSPRLSDEQRRAHVATDAPPASNKVAAELLSVLETTSNTGAASGENSAPEPARAPQTSPEELANMSPEQRREVIRQRFLEAIQRASQQRNAQ